LNYAFEDLGLNSVALSVFDFNIAAIHTYENLGFEREGRMREAIRREDGVHDAILMRMFATEWRESGA
jgi:RimJ/RimL family protein N-acetyltransferase